MSTLLEVYEGMVKSAAEAEGQEAIATEQDAVTEERVEVLAKYAAASDDLLAEEYGEDYTEDDVIKLATMMIDHDVEQEDAMERIHGVFRHLQPVTRVIDGVRHHIVIRLLKRI